MDMMIVYLIVATTGGVYMGAGIMAILYLGDK